MPNWCYNDEYIYGPKKDVEALYDKLVKWIEPIPKLVEEAEKESRNVDYDNWLGNVFSNAGFDVKDKDFHCRGWLTYDFDIEPYDEDTSFITFQSETAWGDIHESWDLFIEKIAPTCVYCFCSEECGCAYYAKRDPLGFFNDLDWCFDIVIEEPKKAPSTLRELGEGVHYFNDYTMNKILSQTLDKDGSTEELVKKFNKNVEDGLYGKDNYYYINPYVIIQ